VTWVANALVLVGLYLAGNKARSAFAFTAVGETIWAASAAAERRWDLASICAVFAVLAVVNYRKWGRETP
jgi:hypothetical protein